MATEIMSEVEIRTLRISFDLTQKKFSKKFQIPLSTLRKWEQGVMKPNGAALSLLTLLKQLKESDCSTQDFLSGLTFKE